jgi:uncharacterized protein YeaO (DUF488 family)
VVKTKRVYEPAEESDGKRVLVDRLWPRGISREDAQLAEWAKDLAPSTELRKWFHSHLTEWAEFRRRYLAEIESEKPRLASLAREAKTGVVTLLYGSRDVQHNHAVLLLEQIERLQAQLED